jgi:pimeloyl-ACP methyl ester carboxylesterase
MEQLIAGALAVRSRIPFRPAFAEDELLELASPVLLLIGERETMYDPASALADARRLIPRLRADLVPGAGHMLTTDRPQAVAQRIEAFLESTG